MKNKPNIIIIFAIIVLVIGGLFVISQFSQRKKSITSNNLKQEKQIDKKKTQENKNPSPNINLKEALSTGVMCEVDQPNNRSTFYFKGDNVKIVLHEGTKKSMV